MLELTKNLILMILILILTMTLVYRINIDWVKEVEQTIQRAFDDNHSTDIATLELNTLKMAMNITFKDLREVVIPAILSLLTGSSSAEAIFQVT
jgi:Fe2+ transport system protein B